MFISSRQRRITSLGTGEPPEKPPRRLRFFAGYAGWGAQQLESELAQGAWLTADVTPALIFDTPAEKMWEQALHSLGIEPSSLVPGVGVH